MPDKKFVEIIREERIDHAGIIRATNEPAINDLKCRTSVANWISRHITEVAKEQARINGVVLMSAMEAYLEACERRYESGALRRVFSLGMLGKNDAEDAAIGALAEMRDVLQACDEISARQMLREILVRLPLIQAVVGSREEATRVVMDNIRAQAPDMYEQLAHLAGRY